MQSRLFDGKTLRARLVVPDDADEHVVVVTFVGRVAPQRLDNEGFGENYLASQNIAAVHITASSHHWYQVTEMDDLIAALLPALASYDHVVTYGSSMGASAALLFARPLGARRVVALSPLYSRNPALVPWEERWKDDIAKIVAYPYEDMSAGTNCERILFYDPYTPDRRHADLISLAAGRMIRALTPGSGHPCGHFLLEIGILKQVITPLLTRPEIAFDQAGFRAAIRENRRRSYRYWLLLCRRTLRSRWPKTALALAEQAMALNPGHPRCQKALHAAKVLQRRVLKTEGAGAGAAS